MKVAKYVSGAAMALALMLTLAAAVVSLECCQTSESLVFLRPA